MTTIISQLIFIFLIKPFFYHVKMTKRSKLIVYLDKSF